LHWKALLLIVGFFQFYPATPAERKACKTELRTMYRMYKHLCGELAADLADVLGSGWDVAEPSNSLSPMSELTSPAATSVTKAAAGTCATRFLGSATMIALSVLYCKQHPPRNLRLEQSPTRSIRRFALWTQQVPQQQTPGPLLGRYCLSSPRRRPLPEPRRLRLRSPSPILTQLRSRRLHLALHPADLK